MPTPQDISAILAGGGGAPESQPQQPPAQTQPRIKISSVLINIDKGQFVFKSADGSQAVETTNELINMGIPQEIVSSLIEALTEIGNTAIMYSSQAQPASPV